MTAFHFDTLEQVQTRHQDTVVLTPDGPIKILDVRGSSDSEIDFNGDYHNQIVDPSSFELQIVPLDGINQVNYIIGNGSSLKWINQTDLDILETPLGFGVRRDPNDPLKFKSESLYYTRNTARQYRTGFTTRNVLAFHPDSTSANIHGRPRLDLSFVSAMTGELPTLQQCEQILSNMKPEDFSVFTMIPFSRNYALRYSEFGELSLYRGMKKVGILDDNDNLSLNSRYQFLAEEISEVSEGVIRCR